MAHSQRKKESLKYGGTNQVVITEDGEILTQIYANTEGVICDWTTRGYKPREESDWLSKYLNEEGTLRGSWN